MKMKNLSQTGFTMVELLVGLAISLLVALVAVSYLASSAKLLTNQNASDLIQENARFAFDFLASESRLAGLNDTNNLEATSSDSFLFVDGISSQSICSASPNNTPTGTGSTACNVDGQTYTLGGGGGSVNSDRIAIDYVTNSGTTCTGFAITQEQSIISVYWVADIDGDGIPSLYCQSYRSIFSLIDKDYTTYQIAGTATPLVDGIESIQVQFGVDTDNDANNDIESYSTYAAIAAANRDNIRSAKIGMLVSSGQVIRSQQRTESGLARTYTVLGQAFAVPAGDGVERRSLATTIHFQNLPPSRL